MRMIRVFAAWLTAAVTMSASVSGLWHVAYDVAKMGELGAVAIVAGFDVTAVIAGLRVVERPKDVGGWIMLVALAAVSASAQIAASDPTLEWWRLLHGAPSVVSIWTLHGAVGEGRSEKTAAAAKKPTARKSPKVDSRDTHPVAPEVTSSQAPRTAPESPQSAASQVGAGDLETVARRVGGDLGVTRESSDDVLVKLVTRAASEGGVTLADLGVPRVRKACAAAGCGIGADRAKRVLSQARERPPIHAVPSLDVKTGS